MTEQELLYEQALAGSSAAADALIALLTHADSDTRDSAAWNVMELISGNALTLEQVQAADKAVTRDRFDAITFKHLANDIELFTKRQPRPCEACGDLDCRCKQIDVDVWVIGKRPRWDDDL